MRESILELCYLIAAVLFITGLKWLAAPVKARRGNLLSSVGMLIAVIATLFHHDIVDFKLILVGIVIGSGLGAWMARTVKMTAMPQMVAVFNGVGGGASLLVAAAEWQAGLQPEVAIPIYASTLIGGITLSGSLIAAGKLQEIISGRPVLFRGQHIINALLVTGVVGVIVYLLAVGANPVAFGIVIAVALILGVLLVIPIGGADMPVVVCLLNSYSGLAAAMTGFVISNHGLIITGALVGASGLILTQIMCKAMNRSLANVLFGGLGAKTTTGAAASAAARGLTVREVSAEDAAATLSFAGSVVFVPGYGLAVAQAQHEVREVGDLLQQKGVDVKYGIHPVAGRMPGHMNVLLAEADVSYDQLYDMDTINPHMERTDVVVVVGANDVVNPGARSNPSSPLYGMPIIDVDKAKQVIFMKRSLNPGFAGIDNELFYNPKTSMLFGDAKAKLTELVAEIKQL